MIRFVVLLFFLSLILLGGLDAYEAKEPPIVVFNNQLSVYKPAAKKLLKSLKQSGVLLKEESNGQITVDFAHANLLSRIIELYNSASVPVGKLSVWVFGECENGDPGNELGILVNKQKGIVIEILLCNTEI